MVAQIFPDLASVEIKVYRGLDALLARKLKVVRGDAENVGLKRSENGSLDQSSERRYLQVPVAIQIPSWRIKGASCSFR